MEKIDSQNFVTYVDPFFSAVMVINKEFQL